VKAINAAAMLVIMFMLIWASIVVVLLKPEICKCGVACECADP
jgi:hypothetical protein